MDWFNWFYEMPSAQWQWTGIIVGFIAFVLAILGISIVNILQAIYGRPKLRLHYNDYHAYGIWCGIQNMPIHNKLLSLLVRRKTVDELGVSLYIDAKGIDIVDDLDGMVYGDSKNRKVSFNDLPSYLVRLPASTFLAKVDIAKVKNHKTFIVGQDGDLSKMVGNGIYTAKLEIYIDGKTVIRSSDFKVSNVDPFVKWIGRNRYDL